MIKNVFVTLVLSVIITIIYSIKVEANSLTITELYTIIQYNNDIHIYKANDLISTIEDVQMIDLENNNLLYNKEDSLYLYDIVNNIAIHIHNNAYNAKISGNRIIFESDFDNQYICKNIIETVKYRNCFKLYTYDISSKKIEKLNLQGLDNYLSDLKNDILVYTSIHNIDEACKGICSYVNLYYFKDNQTITIDKYEDIYLDMSGNAYLDDNILYFESIPNIYTCNYSQIFSYNLSKKVLDLVSKNGNNCFHENSEIISVGDNYVIFTTNHNNYQDNASIMYIYSYEDDKYDKIYSYCKNTIEVVIYQNNIHCLADNYIHTQKIDNKAPEINTNISYIALKEQGDNLIDKLDYFDNLSSNENIKITILTSLDKIGEQNIEILICDKFENCTKEVVLVEIIDKDIMAPKIYCQESINIKKTSNLNINDYGYAIDNVDGKIALEIVSIINTDKKGKHRILLRSVDSSNNTSYKEIDLIIYDEFNLYIIYVFPIFLTILMIVIIYIFRFKKDRYI